MRILISLSSKASEEAAKLGLNHQGFGKYADGRGIVTHVVNDGILTELEDDDEIVVRHTKEYWLKLYDKIKHSASEQSHSNWREEYNASHEGYSDCTCVRTTRDKAYIEKHGTDQVDINVDYHLLPQDFKREHSKIGKIVADYIIQHKHMAPGNLLWRGAKHLHGEWLKSNPKQDWNCHYHTHFKKMPDEHQVKFLNILDASLKHYKG